ncbi:MAG: TonB-dependent receptor [Myxococcaceae bacterium]|nr:TonB-dependent receptor [Myxococcaceae bacterium]
MLVGFVVLLAAFDGGEEPVEDAGVVIDAGEPDHVFIGEADAGGPLGAPAVDGGQAIGVADAPKAEPPPLNTVVVGTSEERTAGSIHTIKSSRLQRFELDDPNAVLQAVPGVYTRGEDGYGLRPNIGLRGANADRSKKVTLMEDGVLFGPAPYSAPAAYYFPLITRMESVRIVKGPAAVLYGPSTVGGAIDLVTRDIPGGTMAGADLAYGQYDYGKLHGWFGSSNDTSGFLVEAIHLRSGGFKQLDGGGDTGFGRTEVMAKARHRFELGPTKNVLQLKLGFASEASNETYLGLTDADFRENPLRRYVASQNDHMSYHRESASLTHRLDAGPVTLTTTAYGNFHSRVWRRLDGLGGTLPQSVLANPMSPRNAVYLGVLKGEVDSSSSLDQLLIATNDRRFISTGVQSALRAAFDTGPLKHAIEVQARYHYDRAHRHHTGDRFDMRSGQLVSAGTPTTQTLHNIDDTSAWAFAALDAVSWGPVTVTPGLRFEAIRTRTQNLLTDAVSRTGTNALLPGVGAHWQIVPQLGVLAGVYRGFTAPAPGQTAQPEYSVNYEAGARWARRQERLEVMGFFNDYSNLTSLCTASSGCLPSMLDQQFNNGRAHIYGLEVYGEKTIRFSNGISVPLSAAYTYTQTELLDAFASADPQLGDVEPGDELPYVPRHLVNLSAGIDVWRVSAHAQLSFIDRMREVAGQGEATDAELTDAQLTLDVHVGFRVFDWLRIYGDARNLTDTRAIVARRPFGARPTAPRTFIVGVKLDY